MFVYPRSRPYQCLQETFLFLKASLTSILSTQSNINITDLVFKYKS